MSSQKVDLLKMILFRKKYGLGYGLWSPIVDEKLGSFMAESLQL